MTALLDALRNRARQRELNALDLIADAARAAAAGKSYDPAAVEAALRDQGLTLADFETAIANARQRAIWLQRFDGLNAAASRAAKLESAIEQEEQRFAQQQLAARAKIEKLANELDAERAAIHAGETARHDLLNPVRVPGTIGNQFREAVAARDAARSEADRIRADVQHVRQQLEVQTSLAEQMAGENKRTVFDERIMAERKQKQANCRERCESLGRRMKDIEKTLAAAERDLTAAESIVKKLEIEVLKT